MGRELYHRYIETWNKQVDVGITPTHFTRDKLIEGGFDESDWWSSPTSSPDDPQPRTPNEVEGYMLYIGRLSPEKGINLLLNTWRLIPHIPLKIIGEGPDQQKVEQFKREMPTAQISTYGMLPKDDIIHAIKKARAVIFPSTCYETFGMVIIEAYACGVAVIGSGHGAPKEIITDGVTGLTFSPLQRRRWQRRCRKVKHLQEHPTYAHEMGHNARQAFLENYTQDKNLHQLHTIYEEARKHHA
jgi:glycosyltransferase involved in cell wall biosynthesis